jgi:hypothetical protein
MKRTFWTWGGLLAFVVAAAPIASCGGTVMEPSGTEDGGGGETTHSMDGGGNTDATRSDSTRADATMGQDGTHADATTDATTKDGGATDGKASDGKVSDAKTSDGKTGDASEPKSCSESTGCKGSDVCIMLPGQSTGTCGAA